MNLGKLREFVKITAIAPDYAEVFVDDVNPAEGKWSFSSIVTGWMFEE